MSVLNAGRRKGFVVLELLQATNKALAAEIYALATRPSREGVMVVIAIAAGMLPMILAAVISEIIKG
jgi:hypothetical protein